MYVRLSVHLVFLIGKLGSVFMALGDEYEQIKDDIGSSIRKLTAIINRIRDGKNGKAGIYGLPGSSRATVEKLAMVR